MANGEWRMANGEWGRGLLAIDYLLFASQICQAKSVELSCQLGDEKVGVLKKVGFVRVHGDDPDRLFWRDHRNGRVGAQVQGLGPRVGLEVGLFGDFRQDNDILVLHHPSRYAFAERVALCRRVGEVLDPALLDHLQTVSLLVQFIKHYERGSDQAQKGVDQLFANRLKVGLGLADLGKTLEEPFEVVLLLQGSRDLFLLEVVV